MRNAILAVVVLGGLAGPAAAQRVNPAKLKADAAYTEAVYAEIDATAEKVAADAAKKNSADTYVSIHLGDWLANGAHYAKAMTPADWNSTSVDLKTANSADTSGDTWYAKGDSDLSGGNLSILVGDEYYASGDYETAASWYDYARLYYLSEEANFNGAYSFYLYAYTCRVSAAITMAAYPLP